MREGNHNADVCSRAESGRISGAAAGRNAQAEHRRRDHFGDHNIDDLPVLGVLRHLCNPERKRSKTIFTLLKSEQIPQMIEIINKVTGGLDKPDTGICFALPTTFVEGVNKNK